MAQWYVLAVYEGRERKVIERLSVQAYCPQRIVWRKIKNKPREKREYPVLPGYVFVRCNLTKVSAGSIKRTKGVLSFLCDEEGHPAIVRDHEIFNLIDKEERGDYNETLNAITAAIIGTRLMLPAGTFAGQHALIADVNVATITAQVQLFGKTLEI